MSQMATAPEAPRRRPRSADFGPCSGESGIRCLALTVSPSSGVAPKDSVLTEPACCREITPGRASVNDTAAGRSVDAPSALGQGELCDVGVALAEQVRATGQVFHVPVVDLLGLNGDGLVAARLERSRPGVEGASVVQPQRLDELHSEAGALRMLHDALGLWKVSARED